MAIQLTPEQERRILAVIGRGAYTSIDEVVEAALIGVEQRSTPDLEGSAEELEVALANGLAAKELTEEEFWASADARMNAMLAEHHAAKRS